ncbi:hypothetical protein HYW32_00065 [Candidatus Berkelbacteria bacterium]|nr:hypothetical protein [Candidatus Berkelbacteria bacterium]
MKSYCFIYYCLLFFVFVFSPIFSISTVQAGDDPGGESGAAGKTEPADAKDGSSAILESINDSLKSLGQIPKNTGKGINDAVEGVKGTLGNIMQKLSGESAGGGATQTGQEGNVGLALEPPESLPPIFHDIGTSFPKIWNLVVIAATVIFMILFLGSGIRYLTAAGDDTQSKAAKSMLTESVIGIALVVLAWPIGIYILQVLGVADTTFNAPDITPSISPGSSNVDLSPGGNQVSVGGGGATPSIKAGKVKIQLKSGAPAVKLRVKERKSDVVHEVITDSNGQDTVEEVAPGEVDIYDEEGNLISPAFVEEGKESKVTLDHTRQTVSLTLITTNNKNTNQTEPNQLLEIYTGGQKIDEVITNSSGTATLQLPPDLPVTIKNASTGEELYQDAVPDDNGRVWTVFVPE